MKHKESVTKVCGWFNHNFPSCKIEKEIPYKINLPRPGLSKQFFRVDILVTNDKQKIGVECKTIKDSDTFRKLMGGIGQAYILQKVFGSAYLAIEVEADMAPDKDGFRFYKMESIIENVYQDLGIGVLLIGENVVLVREAKTVEPLAGTLFVRYGRKVKSQKRKRSSRKLL